MLSSGIDARRLTVRVDAPGNGQPHELQRRLAICAGDRVAPRGDRTASHGDNVVVETTGAGKLRPSDFEAVDLRLIEAVNKKLTPNKPDVDELPSKADTKPKINPLPKKKEPHPEGEKALVLKAIRHFSRTRVY